MAIKSDTIAEYTAAAGVTIEGVLFKDGGILTTGVYNVLSYGATGDGTTDDTTAIQAAITALPDDSTLLFPPGVYRVHNLRITSGNNLLISGHGATLKKIDDSTSVFWDDGAALLTLCACTHVQIDGLSFDGNRLNQTGNTGMNFGILVLPAVPDGTNTLDDNFADDKPTKHIQIRNCSFYRTGAYAVGDDKFGDGIYVFAADDVIIENCYFENMGRWGVVMSDVFNALIRANVFDNAIAGDYATALGAIDIEQESGDATNGSYSSNIVIERNKLRGRAIFGVNVIPNAANHDGTYHYIKGLRFEYNEMEIAYYATWGLAGINVNLYDISYSVGAELSDVHISNNRVMCTSATPLTYGVSLYAADTTVVLQDVYVESNVISNVTNGIYCSSGSPPNYLRLYIRGNTVVAGYAADAGTGIYSFSASHQWVEICDNFITDFGTYGIRMVDNTGALKGRVNNNRVVEGLSNFTGTGVHIGHQIDQVINNFVTQTGGTDDVLTHPPLQTFGNSWNSSRVIDARCDDAISSGDATTDGVIDALRDAMIAHGLIAAA